MKKLWPIILVVIVVIVGFSSMFTVSEGQSAILLQFGRIERSNFTPGLYFKLPFVQQVMRFDSRIQTLDAQPERYFTGEKKSVDVDFYVKWRISNNVTFYRATTGDLDQARQRLAPIIKDALRFQVNSRTLDELISGGRKDIAHQVIAQANKATRDNLGIEVVDVRIKRIELPETVSDSVYSRMRAERKQLANELRSTGKEAGEKIRADADRQRQILIANAKRDAAKIRGEGDAKAAAIYAAAYGKDPQFFDFYRSLNAYRTAFGHGKSVLIVNPQSRFMRYFGSAGGNGGH
ncbi:MAG TPA: protease modulator HflC [Rhodanobacteraceae bacterium]|nr:protease modulator HflC [Rhodanobacteraceae bacterium]